MFDIGPLDPGHELVRPFTMRLQSVRNFLARILDLYWDFLLFGGGLNFLYGIRFTALREKRLIPTPPNKPLHLCHSSYSH